MAVATVGQRAALPLNLSLASQTGRENFNKDKFYERQIINIYSRSTSILCTNSFYVKYFKYLRELDYTNYLYKFYVLFVDN